jgi:ABC-type branched-subunit amino acid transport system substrate-binding protein
MTTGNDSIQRARAAWEAAATGDRARSSHFVSVTPEPVAKANPWHSSGIGTNEEIPHEVIRIDPPAGPHVRARIQNFSPIRIGYLEDVDSGSMLGDCIDATVLACEEALDERVLFRPIEIVNMVARGLPRGEARETIRGYHELCDAGCLAVLGPKITDNALALLPAMEERHVPMISINGAKDFHSYYGFTVGNGGVSEEGPMMAGWLADKGYQRVAMVTEVSPGGHEYSSAFRAAATRNGLDVVAEVLIQTNGAGLDEGLHHLHDAVHPDAIAYCGYGYPTAMFNPILNDMGWDPPRVMSSAFMWYINENSMLGDLEGWVGIDQVGDEEGLPNPNFWPLTDRFEQRYGRTVYHAMIGNSYDGARALLAGIAAARLLTAENVVKGLESVTMHPASIGGPRTYIGFGPYDRKGLKGDWLTLRRVVNGMPRFEGYLSAKYRATTDAERQGVNNQGRTT